MTNETRFCHRPEGKKPTAQGQRFRLQELISPWVMGTPPRHFVDQLLSIRHGRSHSPLLGGDHRGPRGVKQDTPLPVCRNGSNVDQLLSWLHGKSLHCKLGNSREERATLRRMFPHVSTTIIKSHSCTESLCILALRNGAKAKHKRLLNLKS